MHSPYGERCRAGLRAWRRDRLRIGRRRVGVPLNAGGAACNHCVRRHRPSDDSAGADHRTGADLKTWEDRRVRADRGTAAHDRPWMLVEPLPAAGKGVVGEGRVRPDEHVVLELHSIPELHPALDGDPVTDDGAALDEDAVADVAVSTHARALKDVCERPDACPRTDLLALAQSLFMYEHVTHLGAPRAAPRRLGRSRPAAPWPSHRLAIHRSR